MTVSYIQLTRSSVALIRPTPATIHAWPVQWTMSPIVWLVLWADMIPPSFNRKKMAQKHASEPVTVVSPIIHSARQKFVHPVIFRVRLVGRAVALTMQRCVYRAVMITPYTGVRVISAIKRRRDVLWVLIHPRFKGVPLVTGRVLSASETDIAPFATPLVSTRSCKAKLVGRDALKALQPRGKDQIRKGSVFAAKNLVKLASLVNQRSV